MGCVQLVSREVLSYCNYQNFFVGGTFMVAISVMIDVVAMLLESLTIRPT